MRMKWKILLTGDSFDLQELEKSFPDSDTFVIVKESDGYYLISTDFDSCQSSAEVKNKAIDVLDVLNGAKTLALGGNTPIKFGHIVREKADGTNEIIVEISETLTIRDSISIVKRTLKGRLLKRFILRMMFQNG